MDEENVRILISRTRIDKEDWESLKLIAKVLTSKGQLTSREDILGLAVKGVIKYYEKKLDLKPS